MAREPASIIPQRSKGEAIPKEKGVMTIRKSITMGMARMAMTLRPVE
ncbi:hypothetical protein I0600191H4_01860 [Collinsella sp. i06-0019-1H4]